MAHPSPAFNCLWQTDQIRETLFELLSREDICNVRRTSSACCNLVTKRLFKRTHLTFTATSFTRQSRVQALARIGHHIEHLTFHFPHSEATFLPPLVHPESGREISFLYKPHTSIASVLERPKFANSGLGHVLTEQYPPLFHAASNVPAFIHAAKHLVNLRHLTIRTPGQDPKERYRRDTVDYALISLRIALERCPLTRLSKLSLVSVHPAAFMYLSHVPGGFGSLPSASRRWRQIRRMSISVEAWDFYSASPGLDHLKMMDDFIRSFSGSLEKLSFTWLGRKGPCPLSLAMDPLFAPPRSTQKLFHEVTSPMSPLPPAPARKPVVLPRARYLAVRNATMNEHQVADLVSAHQYNVREFDFENVVLINAGSWDAALAPLLEHPCTKDNWSRYSSATLGETLESILNVRGHDGAVTLSSPADLSGHSAAVAALSRDLLDMSFGLDDNELLYDDGDDDNVGDQQNLAPPELDSDLEAARQASVTDLGKQKKRRVTKRRRKRKDGHQERAAAVTEDETKEKEEKDFLQRLRDTKAEVSKGLLTREPSFLRRYRHRKAASTDGSVGSVAVMPETPSPSPSPRPNRTARHSTGAKSAASSPLIPSSPPLSVRMPPTPATTYPPQVRLFGEVQRARSLAPRPAPAPRPPPRAGCSARSRARATRRRCSAPSPTCTTLPPTTPTRSPTIPFPAPRPRPPRHDHPSALPTLPALQPTPVPPRQQ
ncbi:diaphanous 1 [Microdochium nivale]|nr:diaphanous 1 [Microdochium nivale]